MGKRIFDTNLLKDSRTDLESKSHSHLNVIGCVEIEEVDPGPGTDIFRIFCDREQSAFDHLDTGHVEEHQEDLIELLLGHLLALRSVGL